MESMEKYIKQLEDEGYVDENGKPLKCLFCDSVDLVNTNIIRCDNIVEEYEVKCESCGKITGRWGYGYW